MTPVDLGALEQRLVDACEAARAKHGKKITSGIWGVWRDADGWKSGGDCCCVFGAVLLAENPPAAVYKTEALKQLLGIGTDVIAGVMAAFDGLPLATFLGNRDAFDLGARLRQRYVGGAL